MNHEVRVTTTKLKDDKEEHKQQRPRSPPRSLKTVTFVLPLATPGSGKSFCWQVLKKNLEQLPDWSCASVSSDEVRHELMTEVMRNKQVTRDQAFQST